MLAYSDNYKHNNLIYSQVVLMDVTTNGYTIFKNLEAGKTGKKQTNTLRGGCVCAGAPSSLTPWSSSRTQPGVLGLVWRERQTHASDTDPKKTRCPMSPEFFTSL